MTLMQPDRPYEPLNAVPAGATPGSPLAVGLGCTCNANVNWSGDGITDHFSRQKRGNGTKYFYVERDCPVHAMPEWFLPTPKKRVRQSK